MNKIDEFQAHCYKWGKKVFPTATLESRLAHMRSEIDEIVINPQDLSEWADAYLLFFQAAMGEGYTVTDVHNAAVAKQSINEKRKWGKPNAQGYTEHLKDFGDQ